MSQKETKLEINVKKLYEEAWDRVLHYYTHREKKARSDDDNVICPTLEYGTDNPINPVSFDYRTKKITVGDEYVYFITPTVILHEKSVLDYIKNRFGNGLIGIDVEVLIRSYFIRILCFYSSFTIVSDIIYRNANKIGEVTYGSKGFYITIDTDLSEEELKQQLTYDGEVFDSTFTSDAERTAMYIHSIDDNWENVHCDMSKYLYLEYMSKQVKPDEKMDAIANRTKLHGNSYQYEFKY